MPFDGTQTDTVMMLDAMLILFRDGEGWMKSRMTDGDGRFCLLGAAFQVGADMGRDPEVALRAIRGALRRMKAPIKPESWNDTSPCYEPIRELVTLARDMAAAKAQGKRLRTVAMAYEYKKPLSRGIFSVARKGPDGDAEHAAKTERVEAHYQKVAKRLTGEVDLFSAEATADLAEILEFDPNTILSGDVEPV